MLPGVRENHTPDSYRAIQTTWCIAMDLTLSHLIYWQRRIHDQDAISPSHRPTTPHGPSRN